MSAETWHGLRCPKCGKDDALSVAARVWVSITPEGSEGSGDHEWGADSDMACGCGHTGKAADFQPANKPRLIIIMEGGLIQSAHIAGADLGAVEIVLVDYDTEGAISPEDVADIGGYGACVSFPAITPPDSVVADDVLAYIEGLRL